MTAGRSEGGVSFFAHLRHVLDESCDIPELCPGVGPSMGGAIKEDTVALEGCDIPELCPGVGPSMGGFI